MKGYKSLSLVGAAAMLVTAGQALAVGDVINVDITGVQNFDLEGALINQTLKIPVPVGTVVNGIGWDLILTTVGASWLSEASMSFSDGQNNLPFLFLTPGTGQVGNPLGDPFSSAGIIKLADVGIADQVITTGEIHIEFFETFDDVPGAADSSYKEFSSIFIQTVPAPGALALLGLAGLAGTRRRRS